MIEETALREIMAKNIAQRRKALGMTQAELAQRLNYSDKSISKWERGEGLPDLYVLMQLCDIFGVGVGDMLAAEPPVPAQKPRRTLIVLMSVGLVWLVACVAFVALRLIMPSMTDTYMTFIYALPVSSIVLVVFAALWSGIWQQMAAISLLIWTLALSIHLTAAHPGITLIYVVAGVVQLLNILFHLYKRYRR